MKTVIATRNVAIAHGPQHIRIGDILEVPEKVAATLIAAGDVREYGGKSMPGGSEDKALRPIKANKQARALAKKKGLDLSLVEGTGQGGRITRTDVKKYLKSVELLVG